MDYIRRKGHKPPRGASAHWWVLTSGNAAGTNILTCLPKHGRAQENTFSVTHPMTYQYCLTSAIARRMALTAGLSSSSPLFGRTRRYEPVYASPVFWSAKFRARVSAYAQNDTRAYKRWSETALSQILDSSLTILKRPKDLMIPSIKFCKRRNITTINETKLFCQDFFDIHFVLCLSKIRNVSWRLNVVLDNTNRLSFITLYVSLLSLHWENQLPTLSTEIKGSLFQNKFKNSQPTRLVFCIVPGALFVEAKLCLRVRNLIKKNLRI
jgi:hypothetical protein